MYKTKLHDVFGFVMSQTDTGFYHIALQDSRRETVDAWVNWIETLSAPEGRVYALYDLRQFRVTPYVIKRAGSVKKRTQELNLEGVFALLLEKSPIGQTLSHLINLRYFRTNQSLSYHPFTDEAVAWVWLEAERQRRA